jgi:polysaccharide pyruvyl transferase WcaK-like protein
MKTGNRVVKDIEFVLSFVAYPWLPKGLYIGWTGYKNLGDEASRSAIAKIFDKKLLLRELPFGMIVRFLIKLKLLRFSFVILGGGTLINREEGWLREFQVLDVKNKIVFGTGVANPVLGVTVANRVSNLMEWVTVLNNCSYIGVRGPISRKILIDAGLKRDIHVIGDPALIYTRKIKNKKNKNKYLGINFGLPYDNELWGGSSQDFIVRFSNFLSLVVEKGWKIEIFPVWDKDLVPISNVLARSNLENKVPVFNNFLHIKNSLDKLESFDVFLGIKLHSVILSYCANTPAVMVEYRPKCRDFMESIEMQDFNLRADQFDPNSALIKIETLYNDLEGYRAKANKKCLSYKNSLLDAGKKVTFLARG